METLAGSLETDVRTIKQVIINSFRFSRGKANLQSSILNYIGARYANKFSHEAIQAAIEPTALACMAIVYNPKHHIHWQTGSDNLEVRLAETRAETLSFFNRFEAATRRQDFDPEEEIRYLTRSLIIADSQWAPRNGQATGSPRPYTSNILTYGVLGRGTGMTAYDSMFADTVPVATSLWHDELDGKTHTAYSSALRISILGHIATHPQTRRPINEFLEANNLATV